MHQRMHCTQICVHSAFACISYSSVACDVQRITMHLSFVASRSILKESRTGSICVLMYHSAIAPKQCNRKHHTASLRIRITTHSTASQRITTHSSTCGRITTHSSASRRIAAHHACGRITTHSGASRRIASHPSASFSQLLPLQPSTRSLGECCASGPPAP